MKSHYQWKDLAGLPKAIQFESPSSWLTRAALSQGVDVSELAAYIGWGPTSDCDLMFATLYRKGLPRDVPELAGLEVARRLLVGYLQAGSRPDRLLTIHTKRRFSKLDLLRARRRQLSRYRYCPLCLRDDWTPFARQEWRFDCWRYCPIHMCLLVDNCVYCHAPFRLPASLTNAGPASWGIADLSYCTECGRSLEKIRPMSMDGYASWEAPWDSIRLANGRAAISAMYHGHLRIEGEAGTRPLRHLQLLEYLAVVPAEADGLVSQ